MDIVEGFKRLIEIQEFRTLFELILIVVLSGIVGFERASYNKPAGFRTHILVGISAVLVMACGNYLYKQTGADPTRIPAQLLSGIGFLGAGTILRDGFNVKGLTTAASLLSVTCIGLSVGAGYYIGAIIATVVVYIVLAYSHFISDKLEHYGTLELEVATSNPKGILEKLRRLFEKFDVEIQKMKIIDNEEDDDYIKIVLKHKDTLNTNELMARIMGIESVKEVIEIEEI